VFCQRVPLCLEGMESNGASHPQLKLAHGFRSLGANEEDTVIYLELPVQVITQGIHIVLSRHRILRYQG
jgi:hypothetical protein